MMQPPAVKRVELPFALLNQLRKETARPAQVVVARARADERQTLFITGNPGGETAELGGVRFGREVAAATPRFIADAPITHVEGFAVAARCAQLRQRRRACRRVAVFDPLIKLPGRQAAQVSRQIRLRADQTAEAHEFVGAKVIWIIFLRRVGEAFIAQAVVPEIGAARATGARPCAIAPVIAVGETAARPAHDRRAYALQMVYKGFANAADVCNLRVFADPDAVINDAAEMLGEVAVNLRRNHRRRFCNENLNS